MQCVVVRREWRGSWLSKCKKFKGREDSLYCKNSRINLGMKGPSGVSYTSVDGQTREADLSWGFWRHQGK